MEGFFFGELATGTKCMNLKATRLALLLVWQFIQTTSCSSLLVKTTHSVCGVSLREKLVSWENSLDYLLTGL